MTIPTSTYRLQFRNGMSFDRASALIPYLKTLGVSHLYASPIFTATSGSTHGYDVTDANEIDPVLGGRAGFNRLAGALKAAGIGLILDIVPNHMAASVENGWWRSVLEWGKESPYARHFDIDWSERLTLPQLGKSFEQALGSGELSLAIDEVHGNLALIYFDSLFPLNPASYGEILSKIDDPAAAAIAEIAASEQGEDLHKAIRDLLFERGDPASVRQALSELARDHVFMAHLHERQNWQLLAWQEASGHLSYRRFFEVTGLVGVRVEDAQVSEDTHRLTLELVRSGQVQGLRVDHIDGLAEPKAYLERLRDATGPDIYIVVEKILEAGEELPAGLPVSGTTGYEFITALSHLLVDGEGLEKLGETYRAMAGSTADFSAGVREAKRLMIERNFAGETARLVRLAARISKSFSDESLAAAIRELLIAFPVYRIYGATGTLDEQDRKVLDIAAAKAAEHVQHPEPLAFVRSMLSGDIDNADARAFRIRFQQSSGPIMAKAMEDTFFYRYNRLIALNEVGSDPHEEPGGIAKFHALMAQRLQHQPHGLSCTSTHDTKRGEDARARLYALSEGADTWSRAVERWRGMNRGYLAHLPDGAAPGPNVEWMLYQSLAGIWPENFGAAGGKEIENLRARFLAYVEKAVREAKRRSDWADENPDYERAVRAYATQLLSSENAPFIADFERTLQPFVQAGYLNSLSQTLIKMTAPGIPDLYQGAEGLDFSLVDPDNRRAVPFEALATWLDDQQTPLTELSAAALKQRIIRSCLALRQEHASLFSDGEYLPLAVTGSRRRHLVAFARQFDNRFVITIVPRLMYGRLAGATLSAGADFWKGTDIVLPPALQKGRKRDILTGKTLAAGASLSAAALLGDQPVALVVTET